MSAGPAAPMRIAIGIATAGRPAVLATAVSHLLRQERPADLILICSPGPEDVVGLRDDPPSLRLITGPRGSSHQRNAILQALDDFDAVIFFDDDFLPRADYVAQVEAILLAHPDVAMTTGTVIKDGILGPGLSFEEAEACIRDELAAPAAALVPVYNGYGCNMSVRLDPVRRHKLAFDEGLGIYAWLEDVDFSRQVAPYGRIVRAATTRGVHLGVKSGRQSGLRFGYSQVANPLYLVRKGHCTWRKALHQMSRNIAINCARCLWPEPYVDRRGRLRGNLAAFADLLRGRLLPSRILSLGS